MSLDVLVLFHSIDMRSVMPRSSSNRVTYLDVSISAFCTFTYFCTRIPPASLLRPVKEVALYQQRQRPIEAGSGQRRGEADVRRRKVKTRSVCKVCKVSCIFILLTNLIFVIIVGIIIFNGGLDFLTLP